MRLAIALCMLLGGVIASRSTPSVRYRTTTFFAIGSMWISLAFFRIASTMIRFTSLTTGAASSALLLISSASSFSPSLTSTSVSFMLSRSSSTALCPRL